MTTLGEVAAVSSMRLQGCDAATVVTGVAPLHRAEPGQLSFLTHSRYRPFLAVTRASAVILSTEDAVNCPAPALVADNPQIAYARAAALFEPVAEIRRGVHPTAWVSPSAPPGLVPVPGLLPMPGSVLIARWKRARWWGLGSSWDPTA